MHNKAAYFTVHLTIETGGNRIKIGNIKHIRIVSYGCYIRVLFIHTDNIEAEFEEFSASRE